MKYMVAFMSGVLVGAVAALLFAPSSGEELRAQLREKAELDMKGVDEEIRKALVELNQKFDQTRQEIRALAAKAQSAKQ